MCVTFQSFTLFSESVIYRSIVRSWAVNRVLSGRDFWFVSMQPINWLGSMVDQLLSSKNISGMDWQPVDGQWRQLTDQCQNFQEMEKNWEFFPILSLDIMILLHLILVVAREKWSFYPQLYMEFNSSSFSHSLASFLISLSCLPLAYSEGEKSYDAYQRIAFFGHLLIGQRFLVVFLIFGKRFLSTFFPFPLRDLLLLSSQRSPSTQQCQNGFKLTS